MGLALGVAGLAPRVAGPPQDALVRVVTETLQEARRTALTSGRAVTVIVDAADGRLWIRGDADAGRLITVPPASDARLTASDARSELRFEPDGTATGAPIAVRASAGITRIAVDHATGDLHVDVAR